jgi:hypothetical protein
MSSEVYKTDRVPGIWGDQRRRMNAPDDEAEKWTGRRRTEKPKRLEPLPEIVPIWEHGFDGYPDAVRVSFPDGSTAVYDIRREQPHPIIVENINIIRKWKGYNNQPMRRRRKP